MSTHNICFRLEIRKLLIQFGWNKSALSRALVLQNLGGCAGLLEPLLIASAIMALFP